MIAFGAATSFAGAQLGKIAAPALNKLGNTISSWFKNSFQAYAKEAINTVIINGNPITTTIDVGIKATKQYVGNAVGSSVGNVTKTGTTALRKVGSVLESVDDVLTNPSLLQGQSYGYVRNMLGKSEGWVNSVMTKTRGTDKGWVLRQVNGRGQETGRLIQYHPGSRRHFGGTPYWKVSDGANTFRFPAAN